MPPLVEALRHRSRPLVHADARLGVMFAAKAGCTYAVKWFFQQVGMLEAAMFYSPWVHVFRNQVFYQAKGYRPQAMLEPGFPVVKFVRDPYERAVSSYIHGIRTGNLDERMARFLDRPVSGPRRYSFRELVAYLESIPLGHLRCDPHVKLQVHEVERRGFTPTRIIQVEDAAASVAALERDWGLIETDYPSLMPSIHHSSREDDAEPCPDRERWPTEDGKPTGRFPTTRRFYDATLIERVRGIYRADFEAYGYDPDAEPR